MKLRELATERRNQATENLDAMSSLELVEVMNREDAVVARAIKRVAPQIAQALDAITLAMSKGGRLIYVGTGTSGRIGALDASECPPTFGVSPKTVQFLIAGGERALAHAAEVSEDSAELGRRDMARKRPGKLDVVVGLAASGRTPYTVAAMEYAAGKGATTIGIACNQESEIGRVAKIRIEVDVGPEVLTGSSRMKAGTAQKMVCNMLSTGAMARRGYVYSNLMVNLQLKNKKLLERGIEIVRLLAQVDRPAAVEALEAAGMSLPVALVMLMAHTTKREAVRRLRRSKGSVRKAIEG